MESPGQKYLKATILEDAEQVVIVLQERLGRSKSAHRGSHQ